MSLDRAVIKTVLQPKDIHLRLEFSTERDLRRAYAELERVIEGRVFIPAKVYDAQKVNRMQATINALASELKSGAVWNEYHERLLEAP